MKIITEHDIFDKETLKKYFSILEGHYDYMLEILSNDEKFTPEIANKTFIECTTIMTIKYYNENEIE